jgi:hypothetical protein
MAMMFLDPKGKQTAGQFTQSRPIQTQQQAPAGQQLVRNKAGNFVYKPISDSKGGLVVVLPSEITGGTRGVDIIGADGNVIDSGRYRNAGNGNRGNWDFSRQGGAYAGNTIRVTLDDGRVINQPIGRGGRFEVSPSQFLAGAGGGTTGSEGASSGDAGLSGGGGFPGGGALLGSALPFDLSGEYPTFERIEFPTIDAAKFNYTDPIKYAKEVADSNRAGIKTNFAESQDYALQTLNTELKGLQAFAPAASALSREQTALDNAFNQKTRQEQIDATLPGARDTFNRNRTSLVKQGQRANAYAEGRLPDSALDRAMELGVRSRAADAAGFSGLGSRSAQAEKVSDLMSADQRFAISQYGEGLVGQNVNAEQGLLGNEANLFLAPTQYSNTGSQIRPTPEVGAGRLTSSNNQMLNEATLLPPSTALSAVIQQESFKTSLEQETNKFNAEGTYRSREYNSSGQFAADLGLFNYRVSLAQAYQAANQGAINSVLNSATGGTNAGNFANGQQGGASASNIGAGASAVGSTGIIQSIAGILGSSSTPTATPQQTTPGSSGSTTQPIDTGSLNGSSVQGTDTPTANTSQPIQASQSEPVQATTGTTSSSTPQAVLPPSGVDVGTSGGLRYPNEASVPSGYTPVATNSDGSVSAVQDSSYRTDLDRFARNNNIPQGSVTIQNAAAADKALSGNTGLAYHPVPQSRAIAMTPSGNSIYSTEAALNDSDITTGLQATGQINELASLVGEVSPEAIDAMQKNSGLGSPGQVGALDKAMATGGSQEVTKKLLESYGVDPSKEMSNEDQQMVMAASRIGDVYDKLSPAQKSMAIQSMYKNKVLKDSGVDLGKINVKGSERAIGGPINTAKVADLNAKGKNGDAIARNYSQYSGIADIMAKDIPTSPTAVGKDLDADQVSNLADSLGLVGFGKQGGAVPIKADQLAKLGAKPEPGFGIGAMSIPKGRAMPSGYVEIYKDASGARFIQPENVAAKNPQYDHSTAKTRMRINDNKHPIQSRWGAPPSKGVVRGSAGGSALHNGLTNLRDRNRPRYNGVVALSMFNNMMGTSEEK